MKIGDSIFFFIFLNLNLFYCKLYSNKWALKIEGGEKSARRLAEKHGFKYLGRVSIQNHLRYN